MCTAIIEKEFDFHTDRFATTLEIKASAIKKITVPTKWRKISFGYGCHRTPEPSFLKGKVGKQFSFQGQHV